MACGAATVDPVGENALVRPAKMARPGQNAAAVDENRKAEALAVFESERLGGELGRPIERDWREVGKGSVEGVAKPGGRAAHSGGTRPRPRRGQ